MANHDDENDQFTVIKMTVKADASTAPSVPPGLGGSALTAPLWIEPVDIWDPGQCLCIQQTFNSPQYISVFHLWCPPGGTGCWHVYKQLLTAVIIGFPRLHWASTEQSPSLPVPGVCKTSCNTVHLSESQLYQLNVITVLQQKAQWDPSTVKADAAYTMKVLAP